MFVVVVDPSKLNVRTDKVVMTHQGIQELDKEGELLVTHHYQSKKVLYSVCPQPIPGVPQFNVQTPKPPQSPEVKYTQSGMKLVYAKLKAASSKGSGDIDASTILKMLQQAEVASD